MNCDGSGFITRSTNHKGGGYTASTVNCPGCSECKKGGQ